MRLNSKLTWGLAWTGLAIVLAVPSLDAITGSFGQGNKAAVLTSTTEPVKPSGTTPVKTASVTTTVTKNGVTIVPAGGAAPVLDPVDKYQQTGKPLPDYITGGSTPTVTATTVPTTTTTTQVATIEPTTPLVAPVPFPGRPADLLKPAVPKATQPVVIVDETALAEEPAVTDEPPTTLVVPRSTGPVPPAGMDSDPQLTQYLQTNGLLEDSGTAQRSSASVTVHDRASDYDPDGFYLSDGPNNARELRKKRLDEILGDDDDDEDFTWF